MAQITYTISRTTIIPTISIRRPKETSQSPYFTVKGQIGNKTKTSTKATANMVILFLDSVVSNLKEANFLSGLLDSTGCKALGYFLLRLSGRLKKMNSEYAFLVNLFSSSFF